MKGGIPPPVCSQLLCWKALHMSCLLVVIPGGHGGAPKAVPPSCPHVKIPTRPQYPTHIGGHDATSGTGQGQEEERRGTQEAGCTHQWVSPRVEAAKAAADFHTQAHTQDSSQASDESKDETGWVGAQELFLLQGPLTQRGQSIPTALTPKSIQRRTPGPCVTSPHCS